jgi:acyl-CoA synthetase (AMP-forming)/AMP-acid ligase II
MTTTNDPIDRRINTVGRLMPHVEAKVVDPSNKKQILPIDTRGELAVSGYLLMKEYWGDPEKTAEVMIADDDGKVWMHVSFRLSPFISKQSNLELRPETKLPCHQMAMSPSPAASRT